EATADASGAYAFDRLPAGPFVVDVDRATLPSAALVATNGALPSALAVAGGESRALGDAGYAEPGSLSGTLFADDDGDGARAAAEPGIAGIVVRLRRDTAPADGWYETGGPVLVTDATGAFAAAGLAPGRWRADVDDATLATRGVHVTTGNDPSDALVRSRAD